MAKETTIFGIDPKTGMRVVVENTLGHYPAFFSVELNAVYCPEQLR